MTKTRLAARATPGLLGLVCFAVVVSSCIEPAPKIAAIPAGGIALRLFVFGAEAEDGRAMFDSVRQSNETVSFVASGGDGEVVLGLDRESAKCVEPTGYCEFRVAIRIRDPNGAVVFSESKKMGSSGESCNNLCRKALQQAASFAVEKAAVLLKGDKSRLDGGSAGSAPPPEVVASKGKRASRAPRPEPVLCGVGAGTRLPAEEAEKRMAQVDALKRQNVLDAEEFECLRKALLKRL